MITGSKDSATVYVEPCTNTKFKGEKKSNINRILSISLKLHIELLWTTTFDFRKMFSQFLAIMDEQKKKKNLSLTENAVQTATFYMKVVVISSHANGHTSSIRTHLHNKKQGTCEYSIC